MDLEGRSTVLGGQIRCAMGVLRLAASRWWQATLQGRMRSSCISPNKVRIWSFSVLVASRGTRRSSSTFFVKLPWRKAMEEVGCTGSINKCGHVHSGELGVELLRLAGLGGEGEEELGSMWGRRGRWRGNIEAADVSSTTVVLGPSIYAEDRHRPAPSKWRLPRRINQQRTYAGNLCLAPAPYGRMATIFDFRMPWRRLFNLRLGRPFLDSSAAPIVLFSPSGMFPGGEEDGCSWNLFYGDDQGPDCFSPSFCRVSCANIQDWIVFSILFTVLYVTWSVTTYD